MEPQNQTSPWYMVEFSLTQETQSKDLYGLVLRA